MLRSLYLMRSAKASAAIEVNPVWDQPPSIKSSNSERAGWEIEVSRQLNSFATFILTAIKPTHNSHLNHRTQLYAYTHNCGSRRDGVQSPALGIEIFDKKLHFRHFSPRNRDITQSSFCPFRTSIEMFLSSWPKLRQASPASTHHASSHLSQIRPDTQHQIGLSWLWILKTQKAEQKTFSS